MGSRIGIFRRKVAVGEYELTGHAKDEMEQDGFTIADVKSAVYTGRIVSMQRHGSGPRKCVVQGRAENGRSLCVVCRSTGLGRLRVLTVYAV